MSDRERNIFAQRVAATFDFLIQTGVRTWEVNPLHLAEGSEGSGNHLPTESSP